MRRLRDNAIMFSDYWIHHYYVVDYLIVGAVIAVHDTEKTQVLVLLVASQYWYRLLTTVKVQIYMSVNNLHLYHANNDFSMCMQCKTCS